MKVFFSNDFRGHYPVGTAAIIMAETIEDARKFLDEELTLRGLKPFSPDNGYSLVEVVLDIEGAIILRDGDY